MFTHGMEFDLGEDIGALREMVHRFAQERIKPLAAETELLDATVIRMMLVPSILGLLGERAWAIPGWLDRRLPHISFAH